MGVVKTWNGIARASLKTWDGIAVASVKTINGFDATTGVSYDFEENFETPTTGYENTGWTTYGSAQPAYTTGPLQGSQSLYASTGALRGAYRSHTAWTGEKWLYWQVKHFSGTVDDKQFYGNAADTSVSIDFSSGKAYLKVPGGTSSLAASAFPLDQKVHVWLRYLPKIGGDSATASLYYSTDGVRPASPQCNITNGTATAELDRPWWVSRNTYAVMWDRIIINQTAIGDNPT